MVDTAVGVWMGEREAILKSALEDINAIPFYTTRRERDELLQAASKGSCDGVTSRVGVSTQM